MTQRNLCLDEAHELQSLVQFPLFVTAMGKGSAVEELPNYGGLYGGAGTHPEVKKAIESTDACLWIGRYGSDFNTAEFTMTIAEDKIIDLQRFHLTIGGRKVELTMKYFLQALITDLKEKPLMSSFKVTWDPYPLRSLPATGPLTQDFLWNALSKFFQPGDCIVGETGTQFFPLNSIASTNTAVGTSAFGLGDTFMPKGSYFFNQSIWGSIGYATGSLVGVCQAIADGNPRGLKRGILVTGEGSFHLTAQAVADLLRYELKPIM